MSWRAGVKRQAPHREEAQIHRRPQVECSGDTG